MFGDADENNSELTRFIEEGFVKCDKGKLSPNFAVFTNSVYEEISEILAPAVNDVVACMEEICGIAENILKDYVPKALKGRCGQMAQIHHQLDIMAYIIETMVSSGHLVIPDEKANICMFGVDMRR